MSPSAVCRVIALICFMLAVFGVQPGAYPLIPLGLAFWVGSTLV